MSRFSQATIAGVTFLAIGCTPGTAMAAPRPVQAAFRILATPQMSAVAHPVTPRVEPALRC